MEDIYIKLIEQVNPVQLIIIGIMLGYISNSFNKKIDELKTAMHEMDKRLVRVETLLHSQECCMLRAEPKEKAL